jgi:hypothetical protein
MIEEVIKYFADNGFFYNSIEKKNPHLKSAHIKAGMAKIYRERHKYRPDQLARAALRQAEQIEAEEGFEEELKFHMAVKELAIERERSKKLKHYLIWLAILQAWFVSVGATILLSYLGFLK